MVAMHFICLIIYGTFDLNRVLQLHFFTSPLTVQSFSDTPVCQNANLVTGFHHAQVKGLIIILMVIFGRCYLSWQLLSVFHSLLTLVVRAYDL